MQKFLSGLLAPILNDKRTGLSLGRLLFFCWTGSLVHAVWFHLPALITVNLPSGALLSIVFLVLAAYCLGKAPQVHDVILALAGKIPAATRQPDESLPDNGRGGQPSGDETPDA